MRHAVVFAAAALALAGCKSTPDNGFAIDVTVGVDSSVTSAVVAQIAVLDVSVVGAETFQTTFPINGQLTKGKAKFVYRPVATVGTVTFTVSALDAGGSLVALGQGTATLESGKTVTLTVTMSAASDEADMTEPNDMSPDMACVPETDPDFCARLGKNCEGVIDNDNCGVPRTVASCGTCAMATPACVSNVCKVPVCGTSFVAGAGTIISAASTATAFDDLLASSQSGDSLLLLKAAVNTCSPVTLFIADATTSGSMAAYNIQNINTLVGFQKTEETMTLTADGLTIIGTDATGKAFVMSTRTALGMTDFGTATAGPFAAVSAAISTSGGTASWPVISTDGLAFYYRLGGATTATDNGIYESLRATTVANFPAATRMPAAVQAFDAITGISSDHMTIFLELNFGTSIMTRNSVTQPFATPMPASVGPGVPPASMGNKAWRIVPLGDCSKLIGTCEPGGCMNEDICTWAKM